MFIIHRVCCYICASLGCGIYASVYDKAARQKNGRPDGRPEREAKKRGKTLKTRKSALAVHGLLFFAGRLYPCEGYYCHYENGACGNGIVIPLQAEAAAPRSGVRRGRRRYAAGSVFLRRGGGERHAFLRSSRAQFRPLLSGLLRLNDCALNDCAAFKQCRTVCRPARHASRCACQSHNGAQRRKSRRKLFCEKGVFSVCGGIVV